jgi:hypothetical protein
MSKQTAIRGNERVSIYDVASGLNNNRLICECCGESLIAKKGDTNRHHFAHQANSECVYNKNANGSGGVGPSHINAQNNFCKCYNNDKISMRIKYHPKCISGRMCRTWIEFDFKKRFPPNEYCIELEYYYKHHDNIYKFDIAILQKNNITAPPVYNIEILNKHATEEKKRMNIEWVEISAKQVNDQIVCDSRIKPILFYECLRNNNIVENKCDKCVQYTEYQRKKYEREQEIWEQTQREKEKREQEKEKRQQEKEEQEQQEKEKQEQKQREKEKRQQEQWEQEERERKKKEQEKKEQEEQEKKEKEQREREKKEQELNKWSDQVTKQMHQRNEKEKQEQEKCRQQRQNIEILSNQLFQRNPELFKTKDSPQLIGKYEKIAKKEIKPCIGCKKSKRCLTCNLKITFHAKELLISDLLKISISEC